MCKKIVFLLLILLWPTMTFAAAPMHKTAAADIERSMALKAREDKLKLREDALQKKEAEFKSLQQDIETRINKLKSAQTEVSAALDEFKAVKSKNFKNLIKVYSAMSASKLAPLLNNMDDGEVTKILRAMQTDLVAKVIPKLRPQKAVAVSKRLGMLGGK
jgi:flagellar motility protein MotE (MotC chaperone)